MLICELVNTSAVADNEKLLAMTVFLSDRAEDENARKEISSDAFINMAKDLKINLTDQSLADLSNQEPLSNVIEPYQPNSGVVMFKGNTEAETGMSVDQARAVVNSNAKSALKRRM